MTRVQILGGRYRLDEPLGVGGMSVVWKATDEVLRRPVAVKILARDFAYDLARATVLTEAQAVAQLSHTNICNVFDYGESLQPDGRMVPYIVMELLTGPSLQERIKDGPVAPPEAIKIAAEVAAGLAAAHAHGVVHRDVKPGNVILTSGGAKVIDFGIAASTGTSDVEPDGSIRATLSCVAPERLLGGTVLPPSDMFSFGVLLFSLLAGRLPWPPWATLHDRLATAAPFPELPGVPATIGELYRSCLSEDPEDRPTASTAAAVLLVALTVRTPQPSDVAPRGGLPDDRSESATLGLIADADRRRRRRRVVVLLAGLVAVLTATAFAVSNNPGKGGQALGAGPSTGPGTLPTAAVPSRPGARHTGRGSTAARRRDGDGDGDGARARRRREPTGRPSGHRVHHHRRPGGRGLRGVRPAPGGGRPRVPATTRTSSPLASLRWSSSPSRPTARTRP